MKDTDDIPQQVRKDIRFVPLDFAREALDEALES